jgi:hypothetical protein
MKYVTKLISQHIPVYSALSLSLSPLFLSLSCVAAVTFCLHTGPSNGWGQETD